MLVHIRSSKTDPFRVGCQIRVGANNNAVCPVQCMRRFLAVHPGPGWPLFTYQDFKFLTRQDIVNLLASCLPNIPHINTHSFRIGGASAAAAAGVPDSTIQILGRWTSDAYRRYLHLDDAQVIGLSRSLCTAGPPTRG